MDILIVVDMQNDFITGALGSKDAEAIVDKVADKIENFSGKVFFTRDTHPENYLETQEGKNLPVPHCIKGKEGWELASKIKALCKTEPIDKPSFGSIDLGTKLLTMNKKEKIDSITLVGLCTDICVISNAVILKAFLPEVPIIVDASCCAGVTKKSHQTALDAMAGIQIKIENN